MLGTEIYMYIYIIYNMYIFCTTCQNRTVTPSWCAGGLQMWYHFPSSRLAADPKRRWSGRDGGTRFGGSSMKQTIPLHWSKYFWLPKKTQIIVLGSLGLVGDGRLFLFSRKKSLEFFFGEEFLPGSLNFKLWLTFRWVDSMYCLHVNIGRQRLLSTSGRTCHGVLLGWTCWCLFY